MEAMPTILARIATRFDADFEPLAVDGEELHVLTIRDMQRHLESVAKSPSLSDPLRQLPLWAKIWPASLVLGRLLRHFRPDGRRLLELGGGVGVASLIAARHGFARITLTDANADALDFARANVLRNGLENVVEVRHCDVTRPPDFDEPFDIIAAAELLYLDELHRPLTKLLARHLAPGGIAVLCTEAKRRKPHFLKLAQRDFAIDQRHVRIKTNEDGETAASMLDVTVLTRKGDPPWEPRQADDKGKDDDKGKADDKGKEGGGDAAAPQA
ncbi:MAG: class I SAM-dependent methyltransferase [Desulfovibrio sp.]|jgi:predicted nicotinamide N-methyase|nr:class I SAM-dependent methyltransferase [Desulfovibrio sp.]